MMMKLAVTVCAALLSAFAADTQYASTFEGLSSAALHTRETAAPSDDVARTYEELLAQDAAARHRIFMQLSSAMKSRVWAHHLLTTLARHPEFTNTQREVIQYGLSVMTPQLFELEPSHPQWANVVGQPLGELTKRARAAFPPSLARELFAQLGPDAAASASDRDGIGLSDGTSSHNDGTVTSDIGRTYGELLSESVPDRKRAFLQMSDTMKTSLLVHHLLAALVGHPELTARQREVIQYALSITTPRLFEIVPSDPQWKELVDEPLLRLKRRAQATFEPKLARELFFQLGPDDIQPGVAVQTPMANPAAPIGRPDTLKVSPLDVIGGPCTCSVASDWCDTSGLGVSSCVLGTCFPSEHGCGTLLVYACVGRCVSVPL